jgi:hypothetical protein
VTFADLPSVVPLSPEIEVSDEDADSAEDEIDGADDDPDDGGHPSDDDQQSQTGTQMRYMSFKEQQNEIFDHCFFIWNFFVVTSLCKD